MRKHKVPGSRTAVTILSIRGVVPKFMGMKNATRGREAHTRNSCGLTRNYVALCGKQSHRDQSRAFKLHRTALLARYKGRCYSPMQP